MLWRAWSWSSSKREEIVFQNPSAGFLSVFSTAGIVERLRRAACSLNPFPEIMSVRYRGWPGYWRRATRYTRRKGITRIAKSVPVCSKFHQSRSKTRTGSSSYHGTHTIQWDRVWCTWRGKTAGVNIGSISNAGWESEGFQANACGQFWLAMRLGSIDYQVILTWRNGGRLMEEWNAASPWQQSIWATYCAHLAFSKTNLGKETNKDETNRKCFTERLLKDSLMWRRKNWWKLWNNRWKICASQTKL